MRALITGAAGFVGGHLLRLLRAKGHEAHALALPGESLPADLGDVPKHPASVTDADALAGVLREVAPVWVFHLAAISRPGDCRDNPLLAWEVNFFGTENLYRLAADICPQARVLFVGSAAEYGKTGTGEERGQAPFRQEAKRSQSPPLSPFSPITEDAPLSPQDVYAATKVAGDLLGAEYAMRFRKGGPVCLPPGPRVPSGREAPATAGAHAGACLQVLRVRPFNHTGPGQGPGFVAPDFARQIARIERALQEPKMQVGNLAAARDFTDVRDVVRAYLLVMEKGEVGAVYNVCSEKAVPVRELLDGLLALSDAKPEVISSSGGARPHESDVVVGSCAALRAATGWKPEIPLAQTLSDLLADWRARVARNPTA